MQNQKKSVRRVKLPVVEVAETIPPGFPCAGWSGAENRRCIVVRPADANPVATAHQPRAYEDAFKAVEIGRGLPAP